MNLEANHFQPCRQITIPYDMMGQKDGEKTNSVGDCVKESDRARPGQFICVLSHELKINFYLI